jgi:peptidoglycan/LPS O-acetylase OafA/YrhL
MDQYAPLRADIARDDSISMSAKDEIDALTGIRGVAAVTVITYHIYPSEEFPWGLHQFIARGYLSVDLFFVLSGFVMALNYGQMFRDPVRIPAIGTFLLRRIARLYPLYIVFLALRVGYSLLTYHSVTVPGFWFAMNLEHPAKDLIANSLMIQSWGVAKAITNPTWSISTEWGAYFLFPFMVTPILFRGQWSVMFATLVAVALVIAASIMTGYDGTTHNGALDANDGRTMVPMLRCLGGFALGVITFRAFQISWVKRLAGSGIGWLVIAYMLTAIALHAHDLVIYPAFPLLVLCLACDKGWLGAVFSWKPIFELGVLSYTIYVIHNVWFRPFQWLRAELPKQMPMPVAQMVVAAFLILSIGGAAIALHRWVEVPGRRLVRTLSRSFETRSSPSPRGG